MDAQFAAARREKARRQHQTRAEYIPCLCGLCKGAEQRPRTARAHMKREHARSRGAAVSLDGDGSSRAERGAHAPNARESSPDSDSRSPRPLSPHAFPDAPAPSSPRTPPPLPPSGPPSRPPSPRTPPAQQRGPPADRNLEDIAAREPNPNIRDLAAFFARLMDDFHEDEPEVGHGIGGNGDHGGSDGEQGGEDDDLPPGEEDDENFGLPPGDRQLGEPRQLFDLEPDINPGDPPGNPNDPDELDQPDYAAFDEPDQIRNAYVDVFIQKTRFHATHVALQHQLRSHKRSLSSNPTIGPEDLARMAQTIRTVERRLGLSTSGLITTYTLCPRCKRRYDPTYIAETVNATCLNPECDEELFQDKTLASGKRRASYLTYPVASLTAWLRRMLMHPGMAESMQNWRDGEDDNEDATAPVPMAEWIEAIRANPDKKLGDMPTGWQWREMEAGHQRIVDPDGDEYNLVRDQSTLEVPLRFVSLRYGLSLSMNVDWFQSSKEGNYSVGAVYFVINNLPRHLRFLRENICLATIMPGPKEPSDYAMNQMLEPIVQDLLNLEAGVEMKVRTGEPAEYQQEYVYGKLCYHIADLIARIKLGGGAGVASERNFCLHCHTPLSALVVPAGFRRSGFDYRDPHSDLQNVFRWKALEDPEERRALFEQTGNRYTILHSLPGWHTSTQSALDAMHLLYLGGVNWILKQVIMGPNLLAPRHPDAETPIETYNAALSDMWLPYSVGRLPPKLGQTGTSIKADQLKIMSKVMFVLFYLAMRDGDDVSLVDVPRGTERSSGGKHQAARAKILLRRKTRLWIANRRRGPAPELANCFPSRSLPRHLKQIIRFCVALNGLDSRSISANQIQYYQDLLETLCIEYTRMNVPLSPNFHYMMHLEESMLQTGSVYNTHVWPMERANGIVGQINTNGRGNGVLEGTMMRGWWEHASLRNLIHRFQAIPNRTEADNAIIEDLLLALRGGPEHAQQRGTLMAFIAQSRTAYTRLHGIQEPMCLSRHSRASKLDRPLYDLVVDFCDRMWPDVGIFGAGAVRRLHLPREGAIRDHSHVQYDGLRYGAHQHTFGRRACFGFVNGRLPVRIERILSIEFPTRPEMRTACAIVRRFQVPGVAPVFPWDSWCESLGASHWAYNELSDLIALPVSDFSGIFALLTVPMSYGRYWVTVALNNLEPEEELMDQDEWN